MDKSKPNLYKPLFLGIIFFHVLSISFSQNNSVNPARISFIHQGHEIRGWLYKAVGEGQFSPIILLQGSVGQDGDVLGLGKNLSNEGFNVMTFNYPGSWKSEGIRTDAAALSCVQSAINFAKSESSLNLFRNGTSDIILIGYSYGGGMALLGSVLDQSIKKVITIAAGDLSIFADKLEYDPEARKHFEQMVDNMLSNPAMARGTSGKEYVQSLLINRDKYNLKQYSEELAEKELLLIGGWLDNTKKIEEELLPLYRELLSKGAEHVKIEAFDTDHSFTNQEDELTKVILNWLKKSE